MKKTIFTAIFMFSSFLYGQQKPNQFILSKTDTKPVISELNEDAFEYLFPKLNERNKFKSVKKNADYEKNFPLTASISKKSLELLLLGLPDNNLSLLTWISCSALKEENYKSEFLETNKNLITILEIDTTNSEKNMLKTNKTYKINSEKIDTSKYYITATLLYHNSDLNLDTNTAVFRGDIVIPTALADWTATSIGLLTYFEKDNKTQFNIKSWTKINNIISKGWNYFAGCDDNPIADSVLIEVQNKVDKAANYLHSSEIIKDAYASLLNGDLSIKNHQTLFQIICDEKHDLRD